MSQVIISRTFDTIREARKFEERFRTEIAYFPSYADHDLWVERGILSRTVRIGYPVLYKTWIIPPELQDIIHAYIF